MYDIIMPIGSYEPLLLVVIKAAINQTLVYNKFIFVIDTITEKEYLKCKAITKNIENNITIRTQRVGQGKARQAAIERSESKYIAFLDSDDIWHPSKMKMQITKLEKEKSSFSFTSYRNIRAKDNSILCNTYCKNNISLIDLFISCPIALSTVVCRRDIFDNKFKFSNIKRRCDYTTWLRIFRDRKPKTAVISDYLVLISKRSGSVSSNYWLTTSGIISIINAFSHVGYNKYMSILIGIVYSIIQIFIKINRKLNIFKKTNSDNIEDYSYESYFN